MTPDVFRKRTRIEASAEELFRWHVRPGALERLIPPWEPVELPQPTHALEVGQRVVCIVNVGPVRRQCIAEIQDYQEGRMFRDRHLQGPFALWEHTHRMEPDGRDACYLEDDIRFRVPMGWVGRLVARPAVQRRLSRMFAYRHSVTADDMAMHRRWTTHPPMHILVTGSHGFLGSALVPFLTTGGHRVTRLVRSRPTPGGDEVSWDPAARVVDTHGLEGADAVVHLAGESLITGKWTAEKKARIRQSRVEGTRLLCESLAKLARPPQAIITASAIGYYGDRGDEALREDSKPGSGFLAEVCQAWEVATKPAEQRGIRVIHIRLGVVLSPAGGALRAMLAPFRLGVGGRLGPGTQFMSWVSIDDVIGAIYHALMTETLRGPLNVTAPHPVTNHEPEYAANGRMCLTCSTGVGRVTSTSP